MPRKTEVPKYLKHKKSGLAYTYHRLINTPDHRKTLGRYGSPESKERYEEICLQVRQAMAVARPTAPTVKIGRTPTVIELGLAWDEYAKVYYKRGDGLADEYTNVWLALRVLMEVHGMKSAFRFGPASLIDVQMAMIGKDWSRQYLNHQISRIKTFFKWACSRELIPPAIYHGLQCVRGLRPGEMGVREAPPVRPAPLGSLNALLPFLPPVIGDLAQTQYLCAMRPSEACEMRPVDIDRSGDIWIYNPVKHKNGWRGKTLFKAIPLAAQAVIAPRLLREPLAFLFPPAEGWQWALDNRHSSNKPTRKTKRYPCEIARLAREKEERRNLPKKKQHGPHYTADSYIEALDYGFKRATRAGVTIERFTPMQLRHSIVTYLSRNLGQQKAQVYAGHANFDTTSIYNEKTIQEMVEVARQFDALLAKAS